MLKKNLLLTIANYFVFLVNLYKSIIIKRRIVEITRIITYTKEIPPELKKGSKVIGTKAIPIN